MSEPTRMGCSGAISRAARRKQCGECGRGSVGSASAFGEALRRKRPCLLPQSLCRSIDAAAPCCHHDRMSRKQLSTGALHTIPADLRKALLASPEARAAWEDITPLARNEWICWV